MESCQFHALHPANSLLLETDQDWSCTMHINTHDPTIALEPSLARLAYAMVIRKGLIGFCTLTTRMDLVIIVHAPEIPRDTATRENLAYEFARRAKAIWINNGKPVPLSRVVACFTELKNNEVHGTNACPA